MCIWNISIEPKKMKNEIDNARLNENGNETDMNWVRINLKWLWVQVIVYLHKFRRIA